MVCLFPGLRGRGACLHPNHQRLKEAFRSFSRSGHYGSTSLNKADLTRRDKDTHHSLPNFATVSQHIMRVVRYLTRRKINTKIAYGAAESASGSTSSAR